MEYKETQWYGFPCKEFAFCGRQARLVSPNGAACDGNKWLLKTEYFSAFPTLERAMLERGYHVAYVQNKTRWHHPSDDTVKNDFCQFLHDEFGLSEKCMPVGMSCGGLQAVYFAAKYPNRVTALYLDAPVLNFLSCPAGIGEAGDDMFEEFVNATGITLPELINYRNHPIDNAKTLLENNIPIFLVAGDSDNVVPFSENGKILYDFYKSGGGSIELILKKGCGHHPHSLEDISPLIKFTEENYI